MIFPFASSVIISQVPHSSIKLQAGIAPKATSSKAAIQLFLFFIGMKLVNNKITLSFKDIQWGIRTILPKGSHDFNLIAKFGIRFMTSV